MSRPGLLGHGWGRAVVLALGALLGLALSGAVAAIYYRPYGHDVRDQLARGWPGLRVSLVNGLHLAHVAAAVVLGLALLLLLALRPWRMGGPARGWLVLALIFGLAYAGTGLLVPWQRLLPWSPVIGANMARPMPLGQQGPFAELVGVNVRYDESMFTLARRRWGAKATGRLYWAHVIGLPMLALAGARVLRRRRA